MEKKTLGEKVKARREELGMTVSALADACMLSQSYLSEIENGNRKSPSTRAIQRLAAALRCDPTYLLDDLAVDPRTVVDLPADIAAFIAMEENLPFVRLAKDFKESGLSPESSKMLIDFFRSLIDQNKRS